MIPNHLPSNVSQSGLGLFPGTKPLGKRTRNGPTPSYSGEYASTKCLGQAVFDSLLERDFQTILCADPRVEVYAVQAHQLTYRTPDIGGAFRERRYTPDIVLRRNDGQVMVLEVKSEFFARNRRWQQRAPYIRDAYKKDHGIDFVVVTERLIRVQPRLANYERMLRFGARLNDPEAIAAVRDVLSQEITDNTIGKICAHTALINDKTKRAYSALMHLTLKGEVTLDLAVPLCLETRVLP